MIRVWQKYQFHKSTKKVYKSCPRCPRNLKRHTTISLCLGLVADQQHGSPLMFLSRRCCRPLEKVISFKYAAVCLPRTLASTRLIVRWKVWGAVWNPNDILQDWNTRAPSDRPKVTASIKRSEYGSIIWGLRVKDNIGHWVHLRFLKYTQSCTTILLSHMYNWWSYRLVEGSHSSFTHHIQQEKLSRNSDLGTASPVGIFWMTPGTVSMSSIIWKKLGTLTKYYLWSIQMGKAWQYYLITGSINT